jgi:thiol-disulfide isomerase/thioredoxin
MKYHHAVLPVAFIILLVCIVGCSSTSSSSGSGYTNTTLMLNASPSPEVPADTNTTLTAIYFYGNGCSACEKAKPLIADFQARHPELHIEMLEVNDNRTNFDKFITMNNQYGVPNTRWAIPTIFIGKNALVSVTEIKDHFEEDILAEKQRIATGNPPN